MPAIWSDSRSFDLISDHVSIIANQISIFGWKINKNRPATAGRFLFSTPIQLYFQSFSYIKPIFRDILNFLLPYLLCVFIAIAFITHKLVIKTIALFFIIFNFLPLLLFLTASSYIRLSPLDPSISLNPLTAAFISLLYPFIINAIAFIINGY